MSGVTEESTGVTEEGVVAAAPKRLLIGGEWRDASGGATFAVDDPSTGEPLCEIADATADDARAALDAACQAQAGWAATPPNARSEILQSAFELMAERSDELALLMTLE
ncbi:MAG: aldehyde dehydrogenase family protein, partial [Bauldia sp.]